MTDRAEPAMVDDSEWACIQVPGDQAVASLSEDMGQFRAFWRTAYYMSMLALFLSLVNVYYVLDTKPGVYYAATWSGKVHQIQSYSQPYVINSGGKIAPFQYKRTVHQLSRLGEANGLVTSDSYIYESRGSITE